MLGLGVWSSRGYLPHYDDGMRLQMVTYRLADALPARVYRQFEEIRREAPLMLPRFVEMHLDSGFGSCLLRDPANAQIVIDAWKFFDGRRYLLHAWVVMPNHVHVLLEPFAGCELESVLHSWKSWTAKQIVTLANSRGSSIGVPPKSERMSGETPELRLAASSAKKGKLRVRQPEYFDRFIRSESHYTSAVNYIHENPVKAGLTQKPSGWPWSSATGLPV